MATVGMEPGVPIRPQIFARQATGLRKEAGVLDIFVYNVDNQNVGLGVTFLLLSLELQVPDSLLQPPADHRQAASV